MRTTAATFLTIIALLAYPQRASADTLQVTLTLDGFRDIEIPITQFPSEFQALDSSWGSVSVGGAIVGYYILTREDQRHAGSLAPTVYPDPYYRIVIRTATTPTELLVLEGSRRTLAEGGAPFGGVSVATGSLAFLRGATFTLQFPTLTFTY